MAARRWARTLPHVEVDVACTGEEHRVVLHHGRIVLEHHNAAAEAAVFALGGASPPCFEVYRSWRARDLWESALQPRGPGFHQLYRRPPLPSKLRAPLEAGVARAWERRAARGESMAGDVLERATRSRLEPNLLTALHAARRRLKAGPVRQLECRVGARPEVSGELSEKEARLSVRVAPDWYRTVALAARALRGHEFVVAVRPVVLVIEWRQIDEGRWSAVLAEADAGIR